MPAVPKETGMLRSRSKRLSNREEVLKMAHILLDASRSCAGTGIYAGVEQILLRAFESEKGRRINAVAQVYAQRPHRGAVSNTEAHGMHHVIEILKVFLFYPERKIAQAGIRIAEIVKSHATDVIADQRKPEFGLVEQQRRATQRKSGSDIPRAGLVFRKTAMRGAAAAEKPLRQRHHVERIAGIVEGIDFAEFGAARHHNLFADRVVRGIAPEEAQQIDLRSEPAIGQAQIDRVVDSPVR